MKAEKPVKPVAGAPPLPPLPVSVGPGAKSVGWAVLTVLSRIHSEAVVAGPEVIGASEIGKRMNADASNWRAAAYCAEHFNGGSVRNDRSDQPE